MYYAAHKRIYFHIYRHVCWNASSHLAIEMLFIGSQSQFVANAKMPRKWTKNDRAAAIAAAAATIYTFMGHIIYAANGWLLSVIF